MERPTKEELAEAARTIARLVAVDDGDVPHALVILPIRFGTDGTVWSQGSLIVAPGLDKQGMGVLSSAVEAMLDRCQPSPSIDPAACHEA